MADFFHGTYVGDEPRLFGQTALIRFGDLGELLAQFDNLQLSIGGKMMAFGWHTFADRDFELDPSTKETDL
jgi:hypothetical protein